MKLTMMMLLATLLISCSSCKIKKKILCKRIQRAKLENLPLCNISFQFNRCKCFCFNLSEYQTKPLNQCEDFADLTGDSVNFPIEKCEGVQGFLDVDWAKEVRPKVKKLIGVYEDACE